MNNKFDSPHERGYSWEPWRQPSALSRGKPAKGLAQTTTRPQALIEEAGMIAHDEAVGREAILQLLKGIEDTPRSQTARACRPRSEYDKQGCSHE